MTDNEQFETLKTNYDELEDDKKDKLLLIGKKLLSIKSLVKNEKESEEKKELKVNDERLV
jgi:hypothetical protein